MGKRKIVDIGSNKRFKQNNENGKKPFKKLRFYSYVTLVSLGLVTGFGIKNYVDNKDSAKVAIEMANEKDSFENKYNDILTIDDKGTMLELNNSIQTYEKLRYKLDRTNVEDQSYIKACESIYNQREFIQSLCNSALKYQVAMAYNYNLEDVNKIDIEPRQETDDGSSSTVVTLPDGTKIYNKNFSDKVKTKFNDYCNIKNKNKERDDVKQKLESMSTRQLENAAKDILGGYKKTLDLTNAEFYLDKNGKLQVIENNKTTDKQQEEQSTDKQQQEESTDEIGDR